MHVSLHCTAQAAYVHHAVTDLRASLQALGSDLVVRCGSSAEELQRVIADSATPAAAAVCILHHYSPVAALQQQAAAVRSALVTTSSSSSGSSSSSSSNGSSSSSSNGSSSSVSMRSWRSQLRGETDHPSDVYWSWNSFEVATKSLALREPLAAPTELKPLPNGLDPGAMPDIDEIIARYVFEKYLNQAQMCVYDTTCT
jgi:deoxyribodipyrimidine photolyase